MTVARPYAPDVKGSGFAKASFVAALTGALLAAFAPSYTSCTEELAGSIRCGSATAFDVNGWWILVVVSIPVVIATIPAVRPTRRRTVVCTVLLWACCVVALASIGLFFIPAAILMTVAAFRTAPALRQPSS